MVLGATGRSSEQEQISAEVRARGAVDRILQVRARGRGCGQDSTCEGWRQRLWTGFYRLGREAEAVDRILQAGFTHRGCGQDSTGWLHTKGLWTGFYRLAPHTGAVDNEHVARRENAPLTDARSNKSVAAPKCLESFFSLTHAINLAPSVSSPKGNDESELSD